MAFQDLAAYRMTKQLLIVLDMTNWQRVNDNL
jgi:hypothetical protein